MRLGPPADVVGAQPRPSDGLGVARRGLRQARVEGGGDHAHQAAGRFRDRHHRPLAKAQTGQLQRVGRGQAVGQMVLGEAMVAAHGGDARLAGGASTAAALRFVGSAGGASGA